MKDNFWSLLKESVILQATLTVLIWVSVVYMSVTGQEIPELLSTGAALVLGFYFGAKQAQLTAQIKRG